MASRAVSGAVCNWYHDKQMLCWEESEALKDDLDGYIRQVLDICSGYAVEKLKIRGTMVRPLPTTIALAYAQAKGKYINIHILWAGDSRVYLLDSCGLAQLTNDDTDIRDAFESLLVDAPMSNVLSADGKYYINHRTITVKEPCILFAATDGCFGYVPSPMEFEHIIVNSIVNSKEPVSFRNNLTERLSAYAGDDLTMGIMSFYYQSYDDTRKAFKERLAFLEDHYMRFLISDPDESKVKQLWEQYRSGYERYL